MLDYRELTGLDATAQAELIRNRDVQPLELVEAAITAVETVNPELNAVITPIYDQARQAARGRLPEGSFTGVPFVLKDILGFCQGTRVTFGSRLLRDFIADHDNEFVKRLKRSGLIMIGRTNTPEFGLLPTTEPELFGPTRNPWNPDRTAGGSSGGSAAAVAAGMLPMAHASDGGGSIRIPASCCGVFGLKPTRGRTPLGPDLGEGWGGLVCEHAVTRSVRDSAALLGALAGPDTGDPYWAPPLQRPLGEEVRAACQKLRIGFTTSAHVPVHADCVQAVQATVALCRDLGHAVDEVVLDLGVDIAEVGKAVKTIITAGHASTLKLLGAARDQVEPMTWALYEQAARIEAADYVLAQHLLHRVSRTFAGCFNGLDVLLTPVLAEPPVPLGTFASAPGNPLQGFDRAMEFVLFCPIANFTGHPAMSVPLFWNEDGLPVGSHFIGRFGDEATLLRLAAQLEEARPWSGKLPAVHFRKAAQGPD